VSMPELNKSLAPAGLNRNALSLKVGEKAVYPGLGPCRLGSIEQRVVNERTVMFYHLIVLDDDRAGELFIPVEKAEAIGVRSMMETSEIPRLLAHLKKTVKSAGTWKQRALENLKLFNSGSPFDLADIVASLTDLRCARSLTQGELRTLEKARRMLVCEISEVTGEERAAADEHIGQALAQRKDREEPDEPAVLGS